MPAAAPGTGVTSIRAEDIAENTSAGGLTAKRLAAAGQRTAIVIALGRYNWRIVMVRIMSPVAALAAAALAGAAGWASASTVTWTGSANSLYSNGANWVGGASPVDPPNNATVDALDFAASATNKVIDFGGSRWDEQRWILGGGFSQTNGTFRFSYAAPTLTAPTLLANGDNQLSINIATTNSGGGDLYFIQNAGGTLTVTGLIGTGVSSGIARNLFLDGAGNYAMTNDIWVGNGNTYRHVGSGTVRHTGSIVRAPGNTTRPLFLDGSGTFLLNGTSDITGGVVMRAQSSNHTFGGTGTLSATGATVAIRVDYDNTLAPGDPLVNNGIGTLTVNGDVVFSQSFGLNATEVGVLSLQLDAGGVSDLLAINGNFTNDYLPTAPSNTLLLTALGELSGEYTLVTWTGSSNFADRPFNVVGLPSGYELIYNANSIVLSPVASFVEGDADGDGDVDFDDLGILLGNYDLGGFEPFTEGDSDGDGFVGFDDLGLLLGNYGFGVEPASLEVNHALLTSAGFAAVPEPSAALVPVAMAGLLARRRR